MNLAETLLAELNHEGASTRKVLERLPETSLGWRPHARSRTLGELALHVAGIPGLFIGAVDRDGLDRMTLEFPAVRDVAGILERLDEGVARANRVLVTTTAENLMNPWRYRYGDRILFELPRLAVIRSMGLDHLIHHRGQLTVYLRLLDVPVPGVYGPSADEAP